MIKKFLIYVNSDGLYDAIKYTFKSITSQFYNNSITNIYYRKCNSNVSHETTHSIKLYTLEDIRDVEKIDFPRLKLLPYKKWLESNSKLYILYIEDTPAAFSWIHYNNYEFTHGYKFLINKNECWAGPQFVHKNYRGNGLQRIIVSHCIAKETSKVVFTSVNVNNIASNKCMIRNDFELIGTITTTSQFGKEIKRNTSATLKDRITIE